jgi:hypothetical protein
MAPWVEGCANVMACPLRFLVVGLSAAALITLAGGRETTFVHDLRMNDAAQVQMGKYVVVVSVNSPVDAGGVPATACDRLGSYGGVIAAGTFRDVGMVTVGSEPTGGFDLDSVSPGFLGILREDEVAGRQLVGSDTAAELGLANGSRVRVGDEVAQVELVPDEGNRTALIDRSILRLALPAELAGVCYVEFASNGAYDGVGWLPAILGVPGEQAVVQPLVDANGLGPSSITEYRNRPDEWLWLPAGVLGLMPWVGLLRSRKRELALYTLSGATWSALSMVLFAETAIVCLPCLMLAIAVGVVLSARDGVAMTAGIAAAGREAAWIMLLVLVYGTLIAIWQGSPARALRTVG